MINEWLEALSATIQNSLCNAGTHRTAWLVRKITASGSYGRWSTVLKIGMGAFIFGIGLYMFYLGF